VEYGEMCDIAAIEVQNLIKSFSGALALDNLTFSVNKGELFGLIGPDGAGKTTLMRILCGLLLPDSGKASLSGKDCIRDIMQIKGKIGYMPQRFSLYPDLSVKENMEFFGNLFRVPKAERKKRYHRLMEFSRLGPFQDRRAAALSGGMKQKLALSCTLIHAPDILILDEPTTGVDPVSRQEFWQILMELKGQGVTILVSTPYMDEAGLCNRVGFIYKGKLLASDRPDKMPEHYPYRLLEVKCSDTIRMQGHLNALTSIQNAQIFGDRLHLVTSDFADASSQLTILKQQQRIENWQEIRPDLEDVFVWLLERMNGS
jgi:ABC-2 type transport system ATP-binding protein